VKRLLALLALLLAGCGGAGDDRVTVYAAASLTEAFQELAPEARFNFAGSDELATQIREGARPDVYAAASARYPEELHEEGLAGTPRVFATNRLVLIVPAANPAGIGRIGDVAKPGVKLVLGAAGVPVGDYAREALAGAGLDAALQNVVSFEEDVKGVVGKVALGEADAGMVYATDAAAAGADVTAIELTSEVEIRYPVVVVRPGEQADDFVELLFSERARRILRDAGFGLP
jgi:molybdate transport system substrate-binding protein